MLLMVISCSEEGERTGDTDGAEGETEALLLPPGSWPPAHSSGGQ